MNSLYNCLIELVCATVNQSVDCGLAMVCYHVPPHIHRLKTVTVGR